MIEAIIPVRLPSDVLQDIEHQANRSGVSVESWIASVAVDRIHDQKAVERFFSHSPKASDGHTLLEILNSSKDGEPIPGDEWMP